MAEITRCEINPYAAPAAEPEPSEPFVLLENPIHLRGHLTVSHADREFRLVLGRDVWFLRCLGVAALVFAGYWLWQFWMAGKPFPVGRTCLFLTVGPLVLLLDWVACATNRLAVLMGKLPAVRQFEWIVRNDGIVTVDATGRLLRPWYEFDEVVSDHELIVMRKRNGRGVRSVSIPANACADFEEWRRLRSFVTNQVKP